MSITVYIILSGIGICFAAVFKKNYAATAILGIPAG